jgi:broad specificity phosphatase PhoE
VQAHFLTHPEVDIDPQIPVVEWSLSERGHDRALLAASALTDIGSVWTSPEVKAEQTAQLIGDALGLPVTVVDGLAEVDRSATGYLDEPDFWANYQEFLARPSHSARGWETAEDAQRRVVSTVDSIVGTSAEVADGGDVLLVSHGGVGALLMCHLTGTPIQRLVDQPGQGSYYRFDPETHQLQQSWLSFEDLAASAG